MPNNNNNENIIDENILLDDKYEETLNQLQKYDDVIKIVNVDKNTKINNNNNSNNNGDILLNKRYEATLSQINDTDIDSFLNEDEEFHDLPKIVYDSEVSEDDEKLEKIYE